MIGGGGGDAGVMFDAGDFNHISDLDDRPGADSDLGEDDEAVAKVKTRVRVAGRGRMRDINGGRFLWKNPKSITNGS